jgi:hypothetical protein
LISIQFVVIPHDKQLEAWYRTLDQLVSAKEKIEVALYHRLRDLFSFKPELW